eukprot:5209851-Pyramimonas_sp.AAC.1
MLHTCREAFASRTQPGGKAGSPAQLHSAAMATPTRRRPVSVSAYARPQLIQARREAFASRTQPGGNAGGPA